MACFLGTNSLGTDTCDTYGKVATGVQGTLGDGTIKEPAFCFRITITNCTDNVPLTNVTVIDDKYGDLTTDFFPTPGTVFPPHGTLSFEFKVQIGTTDNIITTVTNTVLATGQSSLTGEFVSTNSFAAARVVPASVRCEKFYTIDGGPFTNNVVFQDQSNHVVVYYVTITNTGVANLLDLMVSDVGTDPLCNTVFPLRSLNAGTNVTLALCTNVTFSCTNRGVSDTISIVANAFTLGTNTNFMCAHDIRGSNITASTECSATIICSSPASCRVTGGGRQDLPEACPANVRYVTHGGQVGAPVGNMVCSINTNLPNYFLGNPCIHGRWTHVRHMQGGTMGTSMRVSSIRSIAPAWIRI